MNETDFYGDLVGIMDNLKAVRPVFHSEADFQLELGAELKAKGHRVRLEVPPHVFFKGDPTGKEKVDLWLPDDRIGLELKYERSWNRGHGPKSVKDGCFDCNSEIFHFPSALEWKSIPGFYRDIERLSKWLGDGLDRAFAIMLTNNPNLWKSDKLTSDSRSVCGEPIKRTKWYPYSNIDRPIPCPKFCYFLVEI